MNITEQEVRENYTVLRDKGDKIIVGAHFSVVGQVAPLNIKHGGYSYQRGPILAFDGDFKQLANDYCSLREYHLLKNETQSTEDSERINLTDDEEEESDGLSDAANIDYPAMARGINEQTAIIKGLQKEAIALEQLYKRTESRLQNYIEGFENQAELTRHWREKYQALSEAQQ